jgi:hypothetical protein
LDTLPLRVVVDGQHVAQLGAQSEVLDHLVGRLASIHILNDGFRRHARVFAQHRFAGQVSWPGANGGAAAPIDRHARHSAAKNLDGIITPSPFGVALLQSCLDCAYPPWAHVTVTPPPDRASLYCSQRTNQETP